MFTFGDFSIYCVIFKYLKTIYIFLKKRSTKDTCIRFKTSTFEPTASFVTPTSTTKDWYAKVKAKNKTT